MEDTEHEDPREDLLQGADQMKTSGNMDAMELSLSSLVELTTTYSMKIERHICNKAVIVLIDCGASHNFIPSLVSEIGFPLSTTRDFGATLGTEEQIHSIGVCRQLCLHFPGVDIVPDFFSTSCCQH